MEKQLQKYNPNILINRVVEDHYAGEESGYERWLELRTIDGLVLKITEQQRQNFEEATAGGAKFVRIGENTIAVHQVKGIFEEKKSFGARPGGA